MDDGHKFGFTGSVSDFRTISFSTSSPLHFSLRVCVGLVQFPGYSMASNNFLRKLATI